MLAFLWLAIESNKSLIFAGGTAAGKTTSMNAVSMFVPPRSKVLTIEDTRELSLYHDNWLSSVTRERLDDSDITMYDLLRSALRHRPEVHHRRRGPRGGSHHAVPGDEHRPHDVLDDARGLGPDRHQPAGERTDQRPAPDGPVARRALCAGPRTVWWRARPPGEDHRRNRGDRPADGRTRLLNSYAWDSVDDSFRSSSSDLLRRIRQERGWTQSELRGNSSTDSGSCDTSSRRESPTTVGSPRW